jgi:hypothetical protein
LQSRAKKTKRRCLSEKIQIRSPQSRNGKYRKELAKKWEQHRQTVKAVRTDRITPKGTCKHNEQQIKTRAKISILWHEILNCLKIRESLWIRSLGSAISLNRLSVGISGIGDIGQTDFSQCG